MLWVSWPAIRKANDWFLSKKKSNMKTRNLYDYVGFCYETQMLWKRYTCDPKKAWSNNITDWMEMNVESSGTATDNRIEWRMTVHSAAHPRSDDRCGSRQGKPELMATAILVAYDGHSHAVNRLCALPYTSVVTSSNFSYVLAYFMPIRNRESRRRETVRFVSLLEFGASTTRRVQTEITSYLLDNDENVQRRLGNILWSWRRLSLENGHSIEIDISSLVPSPQHKRTGQLSITTKVTYTHTYLLTYLLTLFFQRQSHQLTSL